MISTRTEDQYWKRNTLVIGVDEAGRGALAGPVAAAAVVFDPDRIPAGLNDSKLLTAEQRATCAVEIRSYARAWSVALIDQRRIDEVNILQATFDAMHQAVNECVGGIGHAQPLHLLIDGNRFRAHEIPHTTIVHGDALVASIAAASILAKTTRDAWMIDIDRIYPQYGFARHKGYGTAVHREAILQYGACDIHRETFLKKLHATSTQGDI